MDPHNTHNWLKMMVSLELLKLFLVDRVDGYTTFSSVSEYRIPEYSVIRLVQTHYSHAIYNCNDIIFLTTQTTQKGNKFVTLIPCLSLNIKY